MHFNRHSELVGLHAFLSASKHAWTNYDEDKLDLSYRMEQAKRKGVELHDFAAAAIKHRQKLSRSRKTLSMYVNDAIGFRMTPEQVLFYSFNAFGTADAISFREGKLRIHDLKTGITPTSMRQLEIYAAFFCLEYEIPPSEIEIELRIYQSDEIKMSIPEADHIRFIMDRTIAYDKRIELLKVEAL